jgi:hypothetical protein
VTDDWAFPRITDFWEHRTQAVEAGARHLETMAPDAHGPAVAALADYARRHADRLDDPRLVMAAFIMAEDLYKSLVRCSWWNGNLHAYVHASAGALLERLSERGFVLNYVVDNSWSAAELPTALQVIQLWFGAAGMLVVSPQILARELLEKSGQPDHTVAHYLPDAREVADVLIRRCHEDRRSCVFANIEPIEAEGTETSVEAALETRGQPGVITVFRKESPEPGTSANLWSPAGVALPGA